MNTLELFSAIQNNEPIEIIETMLQGIDVNADFEIEGMSLNLLSFAARVDSYKVCVLLLKLGSKFDVGKGFSACALTHTRENHKLSSLFIRNGALRTFKLKDEPFLTRFYPLVNNCLNALLFAKRIPLDLIPVLVTFFIE